MLYWPEEDEVIIIVTKLSASRSLDSQKTTATVIIIIISTAQEISVLYLLCHYCHASHSNTTIYIQPKLHHFN